MQSVVTRVSRKIEIFLDTADLDLIRNLDSETIISGITTNPTLMRRAGVANYERFARDLLDAAPNLPVSFGVFSDDFGLMAREARCIVSWSPTVFVKIPIVNIRGESALPLILRLAEEGIPVNITALMAEEQLEASATALAGSRTTIFSIFAGRIADTGRDPVGIVSRAAGRIHELEAGKVLWASTREVFNVVQAEASGCDIITLGPELLLKMAMFGKSLDALALDTVRMFNRDAQAAGYRLA